MILTRRALLLATTTAASTSRLPLFASAFSTSVGVPAFLSQCRLQRQSLFHQNFRKFHHHHHSILHSSNDSQNNEAGKQDFEPTWTYVPYDPNKKTNIRPQQTRRHFSTWTVPKTIDIPVDKLDIQFVRSSGAGGQNVNKVNTQVQLRMKVMEATWIPQEVRERLREQQANKINKDSILVLQSQEYRTQAQNKKDVLGKLKSMILDAWPRPKIRKQRKGISKAAKERNKEFKKKRSQTKQNRRKVADW